MSTHFLLHNKLSQDSFHVAYLALCELRLMNCQDFPWFLLVPMKNNILHLIDLSETEQIQLMKELHRVALALSKHFSPERINIAALGNIVSQMHWHLIVRHTIDKAWPQPVWGTNYSAYDNNKQFKIIDLMRNEFL